MDHQGNDKKNFQRDSKPVYGQKKPYNRDGKPGEKRGFEGRRFDGEKRSFGDRKAGDGEKKSFGKKPYDKKPFDGRNADRKPYSGKPFDKRGGKSVPKKPAVQAPSARDVALKALKNVFRDNAYAAQALDRELSQVKLSDEDRRLAASLFYFTLENHLRIERLIASKVKTRPEPEIMDILNLAVAQIIFMDKIPDHAAVDEAVKQTRKARKESLTALVNGVLRGLIRDRDAGELALPDRETEPQKYIAERYSVALPLVERLIAAYGLELTEQIVAWSPDRHSETIRANRLRMSDAEFEAWLTQNGFNWEKGVAPGAYRVTGAGRIAGHEGYRKGVFSIQGESSMLAAQALGAKPGMQVLDACAAPGGKSCLIAEMMKGAGRVYAWDLHEHRVELIRAAAKRLDLDNIRAQARDAAKRLENLEMSMDAVLVDAPCSGLGVMGDKPDIKYRLTTDTIDALVPIQRDILEACASYVKVGGVLVYSTCTILPEENEKQVEAFLANHPEFEADTNANWLPETLRDRYANGCIQILPSRDGLDGFFIARLRRKAASYAG